MVSKNKSFDYQAVYSMYTNDETLSQFDVLHLYDTKKECYKDNSGFHDSRHFNVIGFLRSTRKKKDLGRHDEINMYEASKPISRIRIFADGSTMIIFKEPISVDQGQSLDIL